MLNDQIKLLKQIYLKSPKIKCRSFEITTFEAHTIPPHTKNMHCPQWDQSNQVGRHKNKARQQVIRPGSPRMQMAIMYYSQKQTLNTT